MALVAAVSDLLISFVICVRSWIKTWIWRWKTERGSIISMRIYFKRSLVHQCCRMRFVAKGFRKNQNILLVFAEVRKPQNPEKNPGSKATINNKRNPHMAPWPVWNGAGMAPGPHYWDASPLTTCLPASFENKLNQVFFQLINQAFSFLPWLYHLRMTSLVSFQTQTLKRMPYTDQILTDSNQYFVGKQ